MKSKTLKLFLENLLIFWGGLTFILLVGGENIQLPSWLQVVGRFHPLLLHFPIAVLILAMVLLWVRDENRMKYFSWLLLIGTNLAGITVIAGLFLATENYEGNSIDWHKWTAVASLALACALYFSQNNKLPILRALAISLTLLIVLTGHFGAELTHGSDFLLAPLKQPMEDNLTLEEAEVFQHLVQPILQSKCVACHNATKVKGELRLDQLTGIQKGGKSGALFVAGEPELSLMIQRIHLPMEDEDHMPPKNKLQLSDEELEILQLWVISGARFDQKVAELPKEEAFFQLVANRFSEEKNYDFPAADPDKIRSLTTFFRKVSPIYPGSPAIEVAYFGASAFDPKSLDELKPIQNQVVKLTLNRMPLQDADLSIVADFQNLETLFLNFSNVPGLQLKKLLQLPNLQVLALSGNELDETGLETLEKMSQLKKLFLWQTGLNDTKKNKLSKALSSTILDFGYADTGIIYPLNPPKIKIDKILFENQTEVTLSHPIRSTEIRYTLDGTLPDSISSPIYTKPIQLNASSSLRARAFASGWIGSSDAKELLIKKGKLPSSYRLASPPNPKYAAKGASSLFDGIKAKANHTTGDWLGYTDSPLDITLSVDTNQPEKVELSLLLNEGAYIFPPQSVEVWTAYNQKWNKVNVAPQPIPTKIQETRFGLISIPLPNSPFDQIRVKVNPISKLPAWHPGAGAKGWVFVDEVLLH
uniref:c-type cytochrome domain-containing protein n=1 Tax=Algoriphagus sp. TaxID=1872435 RepID=UPI004048372F